jgi:hypothetical protein
VKCAQMNKALPLRLAVEVKPMIPVADAQAPCTAEV